jgi:hypothetical protein
LFKVSKHEACNGLSTAAAVEERSHLHIRREFPAAGLRLAFSNGLSDLFNEMDGFLHVLMQATAGFRLPHPDRPRAVAGLF